MADDLQDEIRENASGPGKASGDAGSVEQYKLTDQIAADKHLAGKNAVAKLCVEHSGVSPARQLHDHASR